jgi:hypothetical protein
MIIVGQVANAVASDLTKLAAKRKISLIFAMLFAAVATILKQKRSLPGTIFSPIVMPIKIDLTL